MDEWISALLFSAEICKFFICWMALEKPWISQSGLFHLQNFLLVEYLKVKYSLERLLLKVKLHFCGLQWPPKVSVPIMAALQQLSFSLRTVVHFIPVIYPVNPFGGLPYLFSYSLAKTLHYEILGSKRRNLGGQQCAGVFCCTSLGENKLFSFQLSYFNLNSDY